MLLHDWLVILTAQYNECCKLSESARGSSNTIHFDVAFSQCPQLQYMPRLVFALLRNPLLRLHEEGVHPDFRIYLQCLFRYPVLYKDTFQFQLKIMAGKNTKWFVFFQLKLSLSILAIITQFQSLIASRAIFFLGKKLESNR